jgi:hypothetical protein
MGAVRFRLVVRVGGCDAGDVDGRDVRVQGHHALTSFPFMSTS